MHVHPDQAAARANAEPFLRRVAASGGYRDWKAHRGLFLFLATTYAAPPRYTIPLARAAILAMRGDAGHGAEAMMDLLNLHANVRVLLHDDGRMAEATREEELAVTAAAGISDHVLGDFMFGTAREQHLGFVAHTRRLPPGLKDIAFADGTRRGRPIVGLSARDALRRSCRRRLRLTNAEDTPEAWTAAFRATEDDDLLLECFLALYFYSGGNSGDKTRLAVAAAAMRRAVVVAPDDTLHVFRLAFALDDLGDAQGADAAFARGLAQTPRTPHGHGLGHTLVLPLAMCCTRYAAAYDHLRRRWRGASVGRKDPAANACAHFDVPMAESAGNGPSDAALSNVLDALQATAVAAARAAAARDDGDGDGDVGKSLRRIKGSAKFSRDEVDFLHAIATARRPALVCEVGFNWGASAAVWLHANAHTRVLSFDLLSYTYSNATAEWLRDRFGADRLEVVRGDSAVTIPRWARAHLHAGAGGAFAGCDVIMVDGEHTYAGELANLRSLRAMAAQPRNVLIHDDCRCMWTDRYDARKTDGHAILEFRKSNVLHFKRLSPEQLARAEAVGAATRSARGQRLLPESAVTANRNGLPIAEGRRAAQRFAYSNSASGWFWQQAVADGLIADEGGRLVRHVRAEIDGELIDVSNFVAWCLGRFLPESL